MPFTTLTASQTRRATALETALGDLMPLLRDDLVVEIMLNADSTVWVERLGHGMSRSHLRLTAAEAEHLLRLIAAEVPVELNETCPTLTAKLPPPFAARIQASIRPVVDAPVFTIRKLARRVFTLEDYVRNGILSEELLSVFVQAIEDRANILIGGGTGSGKTTFANALLQLVSKHTHDRVYLIEDTPELQCDAPNKVQVMVHPKIHTWRDAVTSAMRHRPDRIVVGEVRDGAALELLKAWNTGHPGGLATIHANDTEAMLERMCQLIEEVVHPAPRALVAQTIDLCVHLRRDRAHPAGRSISGIVRVCGITKTGDWQLEPLLG